MDNTNTEDGSLNESRENLAAYALNALTPEERAQVDRLIEGSPGAAQELRQFQEGAEALSLLAGELSPPAGLRDRILRSAAAPLPGVARRAALSATAEPDTGWTGHLGSWISSARLAYAGTAVAMAGIVGLAAFFGVENAQLSRQVRDLSSEITESKVTVVGLQSTVTASSERIDGQNTQISQLEDVNESLQVALKDQRWLTYVTQNGGFEVGRWLAGGQNAPEADGQLWVSDTDNLAAFLVHGLPQQPEGKVYHLWLEGSPDGEQIRSRVAIFSVNEAGQARVEFKLPRSIYDYDRAIVTLEDEAKFVPVPTGDEVLSSP
jgi:hypothetical protein